MLGATIVLMKGNTDTALFLRQFSDKNPLRYANIIILINLVIIAAARAGEVLTPIGTDARRGPASHSTLAAGQPSRSMRAETEPSSLDARRGRAASPRRASRKHAANYACDDLASASSRRK